MNNRRKLVIALGVNALVATFGAFSQQQEKVRRIGVIGSPRIGRPNRFLATFREELHRLGYVDGKTLVIDYRSREGRLDQIPGLVEELIKSKVDVLVADNVVAIRAAYRASQTIPIVMAVAIDPVAAGFVQSLRQPGGNVTGVSTLRAELSAKRIELLKELIPGIARVAVLWDPQGPGPQQRYRDYSAAAKTLKLNILSLEVKGRPPDFENAFQTARANQAQGLIVISNPTITPHRYAVMSLAARHRLPSIAESSAYVEAGGLVSYSEDPVEVGKRMASIVARILKGAKPGDIPVEQPTTFEMVINMKTVNALGLTIPPTIMVQATRLIK